LQALNPILSLLCTQLTSQTGKVYEPLFTKEAIKYDFIQWKSVMLPKKNHFCQINDATDRMMESWANAIQNHQHRIPYLIKLFIFIVTIQEVVSYSMYIGTN